MKRIYHIISIAIVLFAGAEAHGQSTRQKERLALSNFGYNGFDSAHDTTLARDVDSQWLRCEQASGATIMGDITCARQATEMTRRLVRQEYNKLLGLLDSADKKMLQASQQDWDRFFQAEAQLLASAFGSGNQKYGHGEEHRVAEAEWLFKLARQRLIALRAYRRGME